MPRISLKTSVIVKINQLSIGSSHKEKLSIQRQYKEIVEKAL